MRFSALFIGLVLVFRTAPAGQEPQPRTVFSSRSELVALHVSVVDRKAFVSGLPQGAFTIYEDGRKQQIAFFENSDTPVTVGLVIDNSGSMTRMRDAVIDAGIAFAQASHPDDEMFVVHFNERVWPGLLPPATFTTDREQLRLALMRSTARGRSALFDAILTGLKRLETGTRQKKALVLVSDGGDNASRARSPEVLEAALQMDALIYSLALYDQYNADADPELLRKLARSTGAEAFFPRRPSDVASFLTRIARELRSGYTIGYVPSVSPSRPGFRRIEVAVRTPDGRTLEGRARSGYMAGPRSSGNAAR